MLSALLNIIGNVAHHVGWNAYDGMLDALKDRARGFDALLSQGVDQMLNSQFINQQNLNRMMARG